MSTTAADRSKRLLELAEAKFGDELTDADRKLFEQTAKGEIAKYGDGDPAEADKWGPERVLKADRIRWLCTNPEAVEHVLPHEGVSIQGARIEGQLCLSYAKIGFPLSITKSAIPDGIFMVRAYVAALFLSGTHTGPIDADGLRVQHDLHMREGFHANGEVRLLGATIGSNLDCAGSRFRNPNGRAFSADGITVDGGVVFREGFEAEGEVRLLGGMIGADLDCVGALFSNPDGYALIADGIKVRGYVLLRESCRARGQVHLGRATIGRSLECAGAYFTNPNGIALDADRIKVDGSVFLDEGFESHGEVRLHGATVGGELSCIAGRFSNPKGDALNAGAMKVDAHVFLREGFEAHGSVRLLDATIAGTLDCVDGHFSNPDGYALNADRIKVDSGVFLCKGFKARDEVRMPGAVIGGDLNCDDGQFRNPGGRALNANGMNVSGSVFLREGVTLEGVVNLTAASVGRWLHWQGLGEPKECVLQLESARIGTLWDEAASWAEELRLDGLVYERFFQEAPLDAKTRLKWIRLQKGSRFLPQPYEQLAKVLKEMGHSAEARKILIAKAKDPARVRAMTLPQRIWHHVLGATIAYGYRPWLAVWWMVGFLVVGWIFFSIAFHQGAFVEVGSSSSACPEFNSLVYSLDTFVPLVDLHQGKFRLPTSWFFRGYLWVHIGFGWVLTTLLVVGLTGLVQKRE